MIKLVVVEGMDNSGKSTLCKRLSHDLELPLVVYTAAKTREAMIQWTKEELARLDKLSSSGEVWASIYDRFRPISDQVYGPVLRGYNVFSDTEEGVELFYRFLQLDPLIIYCRPHSETILGFTDGREQMEGVIENGRKLLDQYDYFMARLLNKGVKVRSYDYENDDYQEIKNEVQLFIESK